MPELPEVETVARTLAPALEGRQLVGLTVLNPSTWQGSIPAQAVCLSGPRPLAGTGRRGKVLLLRFAPLPDEEEPGSPDSITGLAVHLKMTGRLFAYPPGTEPGAHTRVILDLDNGSRIFFDDTRKFGYMRVISANALQGWNFWQHLGPEPLEVEPEDFARRFRGKRRAIKALLLDQHVLAGIGNIYADESLFRAGIPPDMPASALDDARLERLRICLVEILRESIAACGSSIRDYRTAQGDAGAFQNAFRVYGRGGEECLTCGTTLTRIRVAGRATVFCPGCQQ